MGILSRSAEKLRLARRRRDLEADPRPHRFAELVRSYLLIDDRRAAEEVLERGLERFPDSPELRELRQRLPPEDLERRLREAAAQARERPSVHGLLEWASLLRACGRLEASEEALRELLARFGEDAAALQLLAENRLARFFQSRAAADGQAVLDLLRRAAAADSQALKPRFLRAEFLYRIGALSEAAAALEELLALEPGHERAATLLEAVRGELAERPAGDEAVEDVWLRLCRVEDGDGLREPPGARADGGEVSAQALADPAEEGRRLISEHGLEEVWVAREGEEPFSGGRLRGLAAVALRLRSVIDRAARGMQLGRPERLVVEGEGGTLVLEMRPGAAVALRLAAEADAEGAALRARDVLERIAAGRGT